MNHTQTEVLLEGIEVAVAVKKGMTVGEAERRDQAIERFAYRFAPATQRSVVSGRSGREFEAARFKDLELAKLPQDIGGFFG